jgi:hypothetical protein
MAVNVELGRMGQANFKGKRELLEWINELLEVEIPKVEDMSNGAAYC